jgi:transcriptional regulator with GAF, ATPase, and Fis domain
MSQQAPRSETVQSALRRLERAVHDGLPALIVFERLQQALARVLEFKVLTVLKLDPKALRSVRLFSSEPSYPVGGTKQHARSAWSEAVLDSHSVFVARDLATLRATFPDSAAIEATGCGSIIATPIIHDGAVVGTMNLWHRDGQYDEEAGSRALPFADAIARIVRDTNPAG